MARSRRQAGRAPAPSERTEDLDTPSRSPAARVLGVCGLCGRDLIEGPSVNRHHLVPKTYGGTEIVAIHAICHSKIHSVFTEQELRDRFHTFEALRGHEEIDKFVRWVRKKDPTFYVKNRTHRRKRR